MQPGKRLVRGEGVLELCDWPALQRNKMADWVHKGKTVVNCCKSDFDCGINFQDVRKELLFCVWVV